MNEPTGNEPKSSAPKIKLPTSAPGQSAPKIKLKASGARGDSPGIQLKTPGSGNKPSQASNAGGRHLAGKADLVAAGAGTAMASVCAVGLFQIEQLVGGVWSAAAVLIGGGLCWILARIFSHLSGVVPSGASLLAFLARGMGKRSGLMFSVPYLMLMLFLVGIEALIVGHLLAAITPLPIAVGTLFFLVLTWFVCRSGFQVGYRAQAIATWSLFVCLVGLSIYLIAQSAGRGDLASNLLPATPGASPFLSAVGQSLFLFMGFELVTSHVEVARKGAVSSGLRGSVLTLTIFYGLISLGFSCLTVLPQGEGYFIPQLAIANQAGGGVVTLVVVFVCLLASFSSFNGALLALSRFSYALAAQGVLPKQLAHMDPRSLTAKPALNLLLGLSILYTGVIYLGALYESPILAAAVAAALVYAACAFVSQRPPFAKASAGGSWPMRILSIALVFLAVGVIAESKHAMNRLLIILVVAYGLTAILTWRSSRGKSKPQAPQNQPVNLPDANPSRT